MAELLKHGPSPPELVAEPPDAPIVTLGGCRAAILREAIDTDDARAPEVGSITFEDAEQPMVPASALHANLVEASHLAVHGLPFPTTRERWWRRGGNGVKHGVKLGSNPDREAIEEPQRGNRSS